MIPRIFPQWTNEAHIMDVFHSQGIGKVYKVDIIRKSDEPGRHYPIYQAFIYFTAWYENDIAYYFQQHIYGEKKQTRVVYDDPWFWVVFENKKRQPTPDDVRYIQLGYQLYLAEQRIDEQEQCIKQLQECALITTTLVNNSIMQSCSVCPLNTYTGENNVYKESYTKTNTCNTFDQMEDSWNDYKTTPGGSCDECDVLSTCQYHYNQKL